MKNNKKQTNKRRADQKRNEVASSLINDYYTYMLWFNFILGLIFIFLCFWAW